MYNRYIRNDQGTYTRIPEEDPRQPPGAAPPPGHSGSGSAGSSGQAPPHREDRPPPPPRQDAPPPGRDPPPSGGGGQDSLTGLLRHLLDQFHLNSVDTGDLLLLAILFFLFRDFHCLSNQRIIFQYLRCRKSNRKSGFFCAVFWEQVMKG